MSEMADSGPMRSASTPVIADKITGTTMVPIPIPPTKMAVAKSGKYAMVRSMVEP
ncbi:Uncharacterised protein [Mycobacteroides abscessus subsp. abscessus]|nr:Uncharacterised protein [Mycobacteroides abscessus subsp. abscessus]